MKHRFCLTAISSLLLAALLSPARAAAPVDGAAVAHWKPWVLSAATDIAVPAPPADASDQTKAELAELRQLQSQRSDMTNTAIQYWNGVSATQRWHDELVAQGVAAKVNNNRLVRFFAILHTALHDAVIATYAAKYQYNRKSPSALAPDITVAPLTSGYSVTPDPSYPSEHAAIAGTAAALLSTWFPTDAANLQAMAAELEQTRLTMGANYRSDLDAGMALGQAVAQKALARAATDGSDAVWTGTVPTGPGLWVLAAGTQPLEPLEGTWKPWLLTSGNQFRPGPPPAYDSDQTKAELALLKSINSSPTPSQRAIATTVATTPALGYFFNPVFAVLKRDHLSPARETRELALVSATLLDTGIAAHDCKYFYWRARPNMLDPTIVPIVPQPNHPSYVSNADIIGSALADVMGYFSPQDQADFAYQAVQGGLARVYGGIHFPSDINTAAGMGHKIAALAIQRDQLNGP